MFYHGVKVHVIARKQTGTLPSPEYIGVTAASFHDGKAFDQIRTERDENLYGDKAYKRPDEKWVEKDQNLTVLTPVKKKKGQKYLEADEQWLSRAVSGVRQPIETLFGWVEEKTGIECVHMKD